MKIFLYILILGSGLLSLYNGLAQFEQSGRTGTPVTGALFAVALLSLVGGLVIIPGLIGLFRKSSWGFGVSALGVGLVFLAGVLAMTAGIVALGLLILPLLSLILLFISKKS